MNDEQMERAGNLVEAVCTADDTDNCEMMWRVGVSLIASWLTGIAPKERQEAMLRTVTTILGASDFALDHLEGLSDEGKPH